MLVGVIAIVLDIQHGSIALTIVGATAILAGLVGAEVIKASVLGFFILALSGLLIILELKLGHGFAVMAGVILGAAGIFYLANGLAYSPSPFNPSTEIVIVAVVAFGILLGIYFRAPPNHD
jgi:membrane-bound serine protease (ClpP class)